MKQIINTLLEDKKCEDISSIDLCGRQAFADHIIIASCTSNRHIQSVIHVLKTHFKTLGKKIYVDGAPESTWVAVCIDDTLVHLFKPETRQIYNLEELWSNAHPSEDEN